MRCAPTLSAGAVSGPPRWRRGDSLTPPLYWIRLVMRGSPLGYGASPRGLPGMEVALPRLVRKRRDSSPGWRRLPIGAEVAPRGGAHFRVWAPRASTVEVDLGERRIPLASGPDGYHAGLVPSVRPGARYTFRLDGGPRYPDPASRFQPDGPHGSSEVIDPGAFRWTDQRWPGVPREGQVLYEMHVGTFTPAGTWEAAARELPELARAGITVVEMMPVADFGGDFGWGYDGVNLFAPTRLYGRPDDFRDFVNRAHMAGARGDPRRRLQPPRPRRQLPQPVRAGLLHRAPPHRLGRRPQLRRARLGPGAGVLRRQRRLLDRRVPPRRAPVRRHPGHPRRLARARPDRHRAARAREGRSASRSSWSPRTSHRTSDSCGQWRPAATASTPSGTTTSITAPWSP